MLDLLCLLLFSYAEVRAERRRAFGLEELSPPEIAPSSVKARSRLLYVQYVTYARSVFVSDSDLTFSVKRY